MCKNMHQIPDSLFAHGLFLSQEGTFCNVYPHAIIAKLLVHSPLLVSEVIHFFSSAK